MNGVRRWGKAAVGGGEGKCHLAVLDGELHHTLAVKVDLRSSESQEREVRWL